MRNKKGFTLLELLSVIAILAIVMGIVSIAYIKITENIDKAYYEGVEQILLQSGGEYYTYNKKSQPQIFGNVTKVKLSDLRNGEYISEVLDRNGQQCSNESYVGAYKNSLDKVNYYVCLVCGEHKSDGCSDERDYSLKMIATLDGTKEEIYTEREYINKNVNLNFKTFNDIKTVIVEKDSEVVGSCDLTKNSCKVLINETGNYTYYGRTGDKRTPKHSIDIKIDKVKPTFDITDINDNLINSDADLELNQENIIVKNNVKNIRDNASGIKTIRYSFEKGKEKYRSIDNSQERFIIERNFGFGEYKLIVEVVDWAGNKEIREINYDLYYKIDIPTTISHCQMGLKYNGNQQQITSITSGIGYKLTGYSQTKAGTHTIKATLASGYRWSDNTTGTKTFSCSIAKATPTLKLSKTSDEIIVGQSVTFTEKANVKGSFANVSKETSKATVSPASYSSIEANTEKTVTATGLANGSSIITVTFKPIDTENYEEVEETYRVDVTSTPVDVPTTSYCKTELVYNGSSQTLTKNAGTGYIFSKNTRTTAGSQNVTATLEDGYVWSDGTKEEKTFSCSIANAPGQVVLSATSGTVAYPNNGTFTVTTNKSGGTLSLSSSDVNVVTATISENTVTVKPGTTSGNATITVTSAGTSNYSQATATYTVAVQNGTIQVTATNYTGTYDGSAHGATVTCTTSGATIKYGTTSGTYNLTTMPTRTNVGTTTVYYQITASGYTTKTGSVTITINQRDISSGTVGGLSAKTYTGSAITQTPTLTVNSKTLVNGTDFTYTTSKNTNVGTAKVTITGKGNYKGTKTGTFTINKVSLTVKAANKSMTYGGTAPSYSYTATGFVNSETTSVFSGTASYTVKNSGGTTVTVNSSLGPGNYTISVSGLSASNYSITYQTGTLTVNSISVEIPTNSLCVAKTYNGSQQQITRATSGTGYTLSGYNQTNAGTHTITATLTSGYKWSDNTTGTKTFSCSIKAKYLIHHMYRVNDPDKIDYSDDLIEEKSGYLGSTVDCPVREHDNFKSPQQETLVLNDNINNLYYRYERKCFGNLCEYCEINDSIGACLYMNRERIGINNWNDKSKLFSSGLTADTDRDNFRYVGTNPNNYVKFAENDETNHRIIGIFSDGNIGVDYKGANHRIRVIDTNKYDKVFYGECKTSYTCYNANLSTVKIYGKNYNVGLQPTATKLIESEYYAKLINYIRTTTFNYTIGNSNSPEYKNVGRLNAKQFLQAFYGNFSDDPTSTTVIKTVSDIVYTLGSFSTQIFVTLPSDVLLSTGNINTSFNYTDKEGITNFPYRVKKDTSWMFLGANEWIADGYNSRYAYFMCNNKEYGVTIVGNSNKGTSCGSYSGYRDPGSTTNNAHYYRANFELTAADTLFCGGSGTEGDPYKIGFETCNFQ